MTKSKASLKTLKFGMLLVAFCVLSFSTNADDCSYLDNFAAEAESRARDSRTQANNVLFNQMLTYEQRMYYSNQYNNLAAQDEANAKNFRKQAKECRDGRGDTTKPPPPTCLVCYKSIYECICKKPPPDTTCSCCKGKGGENHRVQVYNERTKMMDWGNKWIECACCNGTGIKKW